MTSVSSVDVSFTADELAAVDLADTTVVVVDILRATTTITAALGAGASGIWAVTTPEAAAQLGQTTGVVTAGEREGKKLPQLDLGNSPAEHAGAVVNGRRIAMTTSNGTRTIALARDAPHTVLGCFNNVDALVEYLSRVETDRVHVACAGTAGGRRVTPEDVLFAGELIGGVNGHVLGGGAMVARDYARSRDGSLFEALLESPAAQNLVRLGYREDVAWAARRNCTRVIPQVLRTAEASGIPLIVPRGES